MPHVTPRVTPCATPHVALHVKTNFTAENFLIEIFILSEKSKNDAIRDFIQI
jgi:hypothetical protein